MTTNNIVLTREMLEDCLLNSKVFRDAVLDQLLTREMLEDCLLNSKVFRDAVLDQLVISRKPRLHDEMLSLMKECYSPNMSGIGVSIDKIAFIKGIRELSKNRVADFASEYTSIIHGCSYMGVNAPTVLGLVDSKHLSEHYIALFDTSAKASY